MDYYNDFIFYSLLLLCSFVAFMSAVRYDEKKHNVTDENRVEYYARKRGEL